MLRIGWLVLPAVVFQGSTQDPFADLQALRKARDITALHAFVRKLENSHRKDPRWVVTAGELYASEGARTNRARAKKLFTRFLGMRPDNHMVALMRSRPGIMADVRRWRRALDDGRKLWLLSSPGRMKADLRKIQATRAGLDRKIQAARRKVDRAQRKIAKLRDKGALQREQSRLRKLVAELGALLAKAFDREQDLRWLRRALGMPINEDAPIERGLAWLAKNQKDDGSWAAGNPAHALGVSALGLLAFVAAGNTSETGPHAAIVSRGIKWLSASQQPKGAEQEGLFGSMASRTFMYSHAITMMTLAEHLGLRPDDALKERLARAVVWTEKARNPGAAWRYYPRDDDNDTSVTGWLTLGLSAAKDAGVAVNDEVLSEVVSWLDTLTDPDTGRCGYTEICQTSSRPLGLAEDYPVARTEALTALALECRLRLRAKPRWKTLHERAAATMLDIVPSWNPDDGSIDLYYWFHGTHAMALLAGKPWREWRTHLIGALAAGQNEDGSWPAISAWSKDGGQVYATALSVLCLLAAGGESCLSIG